MDLARRGGYAHKLYKTKLADKAPRRRHAGDLVLDRDVVGEVGRLGVRGAGVEPVGSRRGRRRRRHGSVQIKGWGDATLDTVASSSREVRQPTSASSRSGSSVSIQSTPSSTRRSTSRVGRRARRDRLAGVEPSGNIVWVPIATPRACSSSHGVARRPACARHRRRASRASRPTRSAIEDPVEHAARVVIGCAIVESEPRADRRHRSSTPLAKFDIVSSKQKPIASSGAARRAARSLRGSNDVTITRSSAPASAITCATTAPTSTGHQRGEIELELDVDRDRRRSRRAPRRAAGSARCARSATTWRAVDVDAHRTVAPDPQPLELIPGQIADVARIAGEAIEIAVVKHDRAPDPR